MSNNEEQAPRPTPRPRVGSIEASSRVAESGEGAFYDRRMLFPVSTTRYQAPTVYSVSQPVN